MHLDVIKVFYSPTNAQVIVLKNNIKIYIKIAPTCSGAVTPSSGSALFVLAKVTLVKMLLILTGVTLTSINNAVPEGGATAPKHVGAILM